MKLDAPINSNDRYLHGINIRLDALIQQVNSIVEYLASKDKVAVTEQVVETKQVEPDFKSKQRRK
jgi:hypothetical protein